MDWTTLLGLAARHVLTSTGGWLAGHGLLAADAQSEFVGGGMIMLGVGWSTWQKWRAGGLPLPPSALRVLPLLVVLPLLGGCVTMSAGEIGALMDRVNSRIVTADELAHKFCPSLAIVNASAKSVACAAKASGSSQKTLGKVIAYGKAFCDNPTSAGVASLTANVGTGIRAVLAADAAGCQ